MKVWRANVRSHKVDREPIPESWQRMGGRGLIARTLLDEVPADCEPLGPSNKLILAPGLLVGHKISSCDRISIGAKSPLTGGVKESNAGGSTGLMLSHLGMRALVLEDQPQDERWFVLLLNSAGGRFEPADDLIGLGVYDTAQTLLERYGSHVGLALIGKGGEMGLRSAGIQNLDKDREPSRIAARGGLGAVMGSKALKAIVIDSSSWCTPSHRRIKGTLQRSEGLLHEGVDGSSPDRSLFRIWHRGHGELMQPYRGDAHEKLHHWLF